jgi:aminoglycoside 6'-N-acetyltransferase
MDLHGPRITLRSPTVADADALISILVEPEVARWWPGFDRQRVLDELIAERIAEEPFVIELDRQVVGYIQVAEELEPDFLHAGIDLFLTAGAQGRGLGPEAIRVLAADLIDRRGHHRLIIDPVADNVRAIAAYAKVGFRPVGRMRQYQRMADGSWADALLMELLADELARDNG